MKSRSLPPRSMHGMSLVELMVAITIGLIILAAISTILVNSRTNYATQESIARLQESGRIAMQLIARDLRLAGYYGCADDTQKMNTVLQSTAGVAFNYSVFVEGVEGNGAVLLPSNTSVTFPTAGTAVTSREPACPNFIGGKCQGTDAIALRMSDPASRVLLASTMLSETAAMTISTNGFNVGDVVVVSDCGSADLVQITGITGASSTFSLAHIPFSGSAATPGNSNPAALSRPYGVPFGQITRYDNRIYYVGTGTSGYPALFRQRIDGAGVPEELIEGIQDMEIWYGLALASAFPDRTPRSYVPANDATLNTVINASTGETNWTNVVSTRIEFMSIPMNTTNPSAVNASTPVQPKQFTSTILLRNAQ